MLSNKIETALNNQVQSEIYSSYLYLAMAAYCAGEGFHGFAHWFKSQSKEEWGHAMKIFEYVLSRGGHSELKAIKAPPSSFRSIPDTMQQTLKHEQAVTHSINALYELAGKEKDYATQVALQWFVTEQVEEEAGVQEILQKIDLLKQSPSGLLYLDKELKKREAK